jgi:hypothetical protein
MPSDAVSVGAGYFLTPSGDLYYKGTLFASGVASANGLTNQNPDGGYNWCQYVLKTGGAINVQGAPGGGTPTQWESWSVPADAVSVGAGYFLTQSGDLYYKDTKFASGVASANGLTNPGNGYNWCQYVLKTGGAINVKGDPAGGTPTQWESWSSVPADAVSVGAGYFLTPSGALYYKDTKFASNVTSATGLTNPQNGANWGQYMVSPC